jgi:hypothetical protein
MSHNPKVVVSNPTPATNNDRSRQELHLAAFLFLKTVSETVSGLLDDSGQTPDTYKADQRPPVFRLEKQSLQ